MTQSSDICVMKHRHQPDRPRPAVDGLRLCFGCRENLAEDITDLPGLHQQLGDQLTDATANSDSSGRSSSGRSIPLPINMGIVSWRDQIEHDLIWWAATYVAPRRGITTPDHRDPTTVAMWLGRHVDWIAADYQAAEECPGVMRELVGRSRALLNPSGSKRIEIGPCRQPVDGSAPAICPGTLFATVRADDDPRPSYIYCSTCTFQKEPTEWLRFGKTYGARHATA